MLRKTISGLSLVAIMATGAAAQIGGPPFQDNTFDFISGTSNFSSYLAKFTGTAVGQTVAVSQSLTGETIGSPFQIWCMDPLHGVNAGTSVNAWVTPLALANGTAQTNFTYTYTANPSDVVAPFGGGALNNITTFETVAWLASQMGQNATYSNALLYEHAIWIALGYTVVDNAAATLAGSVTNANRSSVILSDWNIVNDYYSTTQYQEFIYCEAGHQCISPPGNPQSVTPEPGTISMIATGLVGLSGASMRRRRKTRKS